MNQESRELWSEHPIVGFDTETTGVDPVADRLVTASVVVVDASGVQKSYWLADPGVDIPLPAQNVHGISTEQARREGEPIRKVLDEVAQLLHVHMEQNHPIVAFNASFDFTLIEHELARHDLPTLAQRLGRPIGPVLDPFMLDKTVDKFRRGKRNLETVARFYGVWNADNFHNAEADVIVTLRVLGALLRRYPNVARESLEDLMTTQVETYTDMTNYFARKALENGREPDLHVGWPVAN
ncbi:MAG: exonuclease domain-containing protein [Actinomycetaceae bacterium]|nr:DNA polymerase III subunit epsilon [Arcanobacterium sp.]MDD7686810.1 exonuclease domain-containing protein [Actinomycetaceae bacterium]MDY5273607.1 exonuclease domain-containing protein [Arcanobacterium sp.]